MLFKGERERGREKRKYLGSISIFDLMTSSSAKCASLRQLDGFYRLYPKLASWGKSFLSTSITRLNLAFFPFLCAFCFSLCSFLLVLLTRSMIIHVHRAYHDARLREREKEKPDEKAEHFSATKTRNKINMYIVSVSFRGNIDVAFKREKKI